MSSPLTFLFSSLRLGAEAGTGEVESEAKMTPIMPAKQSMTWSTMASARACSRSSLPARPVFLAQKRAIVTDCPTSSPSQDSTGREWNGVPVMTKIAFKIYIPFRSPCFFRTS